MIHWKKYWKYGVGFIFHEEIDFSTISVWAWTEKKCGNESHEKETKHIYESVAGLLHVRVGLL